ncbi:hypothetical protein LIPSTDRAFT_76724 [Lipomyces starkeyi NRRL Y-11557]|uniref:Uncharacterized protein n=1 Tax=Lipomyces starkeyi NRRL Y-11557 TaxID=675824 RepID=A0A1E3PTR4_LIPST|nr:hypothetical protein LIPSTDRAFT_76724 [Lipomyces starkeyi NRRL Y-11557]
MDSAKIFVDNIHTLLSAIPSHVIQQIYETTLVQFPQTSAILRIWTGDCAQQDTHFLLTSF